MDVKSIVFGMAAASGIWLIVTILLLIRGRKREDSWYKECLRLIDHYDRAIEQFKYNIRVNNKKIITEEEMDRMKNFP